ncbi:MAG: CUAEP/CCAEP-tail radical SAM (seleno)protein [Acidimicrobiales bacterium]
MRVLLISTYELGHQPLHIASPAQALRRCSHQVRCVDTSIDPWQPSETDDVDIVAISVPMHTAMRLALDIARTIRARHPELPICLYGLYGGVARDHTLGPVADRLIAGEYETALCDWVDGHHDTTITYLERTPRGLPARDLLPPLTRYARLLIDGEERVAAGVQASHGCASRCRHCPVPAVYDGRIRIVSSETVLADIDQAVALGAAHITFTDPDFLNGPHHSLRVVRAMHQRHPNLTFDLTTKIELILRHRDLWTELASSGCLFVTTALECVDDNILAILDKGHTAAHAGEAIRLLRSAGIEPRPSLLPFTPWTTLSGLADLVDFAIDNQLVGNIDPVHWTIRLLIPDHSLLLTQPEMRTYLDGYDAELLGWRWHAADPNIDVLQRDLALLVEADVVAIHEPTDTFNKVAEKIARAADRTFPQVQARPTTAPRLTEAWFCCAEPTCEQRTQTPDRTPFEVSRSTAHRSPQRSRL